MRQATWFEAQGPGILRASVQQLLGLQPRLQGGQRTTTPGQEARRVFMRLLPHALGGQECDEASVISLVRPGFARRLRIIRRHLRRM